MLCVLPDKSVRCCRPSERGTYASAVFFKAQKTEETQGTQHYHLHIALVRLILEELTSHSYINPPHFRKAVKHPLPTVVDISFDVSHTHTRTCSSN